MRCAWRSVCPAYAASPEATASFTALVGCYSDHQLAEIRARIAERGRVPIETPITAIWSRNDGIVAPEACIDRDSPDVEHIEVTSTHLGMGVDPDVWIVVADRVRASPKPTDLSRAACA